MLPTLQISQSAATQRDKEIDTNERKVERQGINFRASEQKSVGTIKSLNDLYALSRLRVLFPCKS